MKRLLIGLIGLFIGGAAAAATLDEDFTNLGPDVWMLKYIDNSRLISMLRDYEDVTAANTITYSECGTTYFLNSATEFASTLPAPEAGCTFKFIVRAAPVGTAYTVVTSGGSNLIDGIAVVNGASVACANEDTITFTAGAAVSGDWVELVSDGTNWYVTGIASAATGIACSAT